MDDRLHNPLARGAADGLEGARTRAGSPLRFTRHTAAASRACSRGDLLTLLLALLVFFARDASAQNATPDVATAVANVQAFYNRTSTFSADFAQQYLAKAYNQTKTSAGHVIFSKPGKMDWNTATRRTTASSPTARRSASTRPGPSRCTSRTSTQSQYPAALSFLTGQGSLDSNFTFQIMPGAQMSAPGGLRPRRVAQDADARVHEGALLRRLGDLAGAPRAHPRRAAEPKPVRLHERPGERQRRPAEVHVHASGGDDHRQALTVNRPHHHSLRALLPEPDTHRRSVQGPTSSVRCQNDCRRVRRELRA